MLEPALGGLERGRHVENRSPVLNRNDAAVAECLAVPGPVDVVDDRCGDIAATQEIGMQGMRGPPVDRVVRRRQRLPENLTTENLRAADVAALAAEDVLLDPLELEQMQEVGEDRVHFFSLRFSRAIKLDVSQRRPPMPTTSA